MSQIKSNKKRAPQHRENEAITFASLEEETGTLVHCNVIQKADGMDVHGITSSTPGHSSTYTSIRTDNQDFTTSAALSKCEVLGSSPRFPQMLTSHRTFEIHHAPSLLTADHLPVLCFSSTTLLHPFEAHRCGETEGLVEAGGNGWSQPECLSDPNVAAATRSRTPPPAAVPPPPPTDDPFHDDWPHW